MFKLPVCPYCNTIYRYKDVKETKGEKQHKCYHCNKNFNVKLFPGIVILWIILIVVTVLLNIAILLVMPVFNLIPLIVISVVAVLLGICFIPFFMSYKKIKDKK